jgi:hypothetical protein
MVEAREKCTVRAFSRFDTSSGFLLERKASFTLAAGPGCGSGSDKMMTILSGSESTTRGLRTVLNTRMRQVLIFLLIGDSYVQPL